MKKKKNDILMNNNDFHMNEEVKHYIKIVVGLVIFILAFYFMMTGIKVKIDPEYKERESTINYTDLTKAEILNQSKKEYCVYLYRREKENENVSQQISYKNMSSKYPIYKVDIDNHLSASLKAKSKDKEILSNDLKELKVYKEALLLIKDGKVMKVIPSSEVLKYIESTKDEK